MNRSTVLKAKLAINDRINVITGFQVAKSALAIRLSGHMLDELAAVAFAASARPGANVDQIPAIIISLTESRMLGIVEEGEELVEETPFTLGGQPVI